MAEKNGFEVLCDNLENDPNKPYGNKVEYIKNKNIQIMHKKMLQNS